MKGAATLERMAIEPDRRISEVVKREQSRLQNFIRRRVPDRRDARDILQDVFYELSLNTLLSRKPYAVLHRRERLQSIYDEFTKA
jgi:hypothetical protein